jgi:hypothetical protein
MNKFAESSYTGGVTSLDHLSAVMRALAEDCVPVKPGDENIFGEVFTAESAAVSNDIALERVGKEIARLAQYL